MSKTFLHDAISLPIKYKVGDVIEVPFKGNLVWEKKMADR